MSGAFNSGYGHCDVAAALLERKASFFMLCFLFCKIWGFYPNSWEIHFQLSFFISNLHRNFMNVAGRLIPHDSCGVFSRQIFTTVATLNLQPLQQLARQEVPESSEMLGFWVSCGCKNAGGLVGYGFYFLEVWGMWFPNWLPVASKWRLPWQAEG